MNHTNEEFLASAKQKKTYSKLNTSPFAEHLKPSSQAFFGEKKIIPTIAHSNMREDFKKLFLPLLIDIFELRQMLDNYKLKQQYPDLYTFEKEARKPAEIMDQLKQIQLEIEESQRWCQGVILQITKGIEQAQETVKMIEQNEKDLVATRSGTFKSLLNKCKELLWKRK